MYQESWYTLTHAQTVCTRPSFSGLGTKLDTTRLRTVLDIYMAVPIEEVNDAITFEQSTFS